MVALDLDTIRRSAERGDPQLSATVVAPLGPIFKEMNYV